MGQYSLDMCMLVADELRKTYFGAELVYKLFALAKTQITNRKNGHLPADDSQPAGTSNLMRHSSHDTIQGNRNVADIDTMTNPDFAFTSLEGIFNRYESVHTLDMFISIVKKLTY